MVGRKPNFLNKEAIIILMRVLDCSVSKRQKGMRKQIMWNGQHLRKEREVCKTEVKLTRLQYRTSELGGKYNFVTALECRN